MGENSTQVNFEAAATMFAPKTISNILKEVSMIDDFSMKSARLDFYVHLLEEEMRKIDAFKRELPRCMYLIKDAIEILKEESLKWKGKQMEQFMPLKKNDSFENGGVKWSDEKKNWLNSTQLWNTTIQYENPDSGSGKYQQGEGSGIGSQVQGCSFQSRGGAFVPFKKAFVGIQMEEKKASPDGLSLSMGNDDVEPIDLNVKKDCYGFVRPQQQLDEMYQNQQQKKQRRCWSPELHKLFVEALQQLGGHKSATPKMIRELMKVDGLTNDEVKSHLQKFRLHIKKLPSSSAGPSKFPWLNQCGDLNKAKTGSSGSPQGPFQNGPGPAKVGSGTAGESMDEDEEDRSESPSWMGRYLRSSHKQA